MELLVKCPGCEGQGWFPCLPFDSPWTTGKIVGYFTDDEVEGEEVAMECLACDGLGYVSKEDFKRIYRQMESGFKTVKYSEDEGGN